MMKKLLPILIALGLIAPAFALATTSADCQAYYGQTFEWDQNRQTGSNKGACVNTTNGTTWPEPTAGSSIQPSNPDLTQTPDTSGLTTQGQTQSQNGSSNATPSASTPSPQTNPPGVDPNEGIPVSPTGPASCGSAGADPATCIPSGESTTAGGAIPTAQQGSPSGTTNQPNQNTSSAGGSSNVSPFCTLQGGRTVCTYVPLEPLPCTDKNGNQLKPGSCQTGNLAFPNLLAAAFKLLITLGSLFAVVMIVVYGILYMLSNTPVKLAGAKERMQNALIGLLILGGAWLIIYTVNPKLLNFNLLTQDLETSARNAGTPVQNSGGAQAQAQANQNVIDGCQLNQGGVLQYQSDGSLRCIPANR